MTESKLSELETLKAQLAILSDGVSTAAKVRDDLRELLNKAVANLWHERIQIPVAAAMPTVVPCKDTCVKCEMEKVLRSAPPSAQNSALTADVAQNMRSTAGSWYAQFPFVKTNAGEERKDLAQVPAAPCKEADSSVGDGVVTTEQLEDSQGAIPAENRLSPSRLRSKSGSAHCSSKAGLGSETAPTADGLAPQEDEPTDMTELLRHQEKMFRRENIDEDFAGMATDERYQQETKKVLQEFSGPQDSPSRSEIEKLLMALANCYILMQPEGFEVGFICEALGGKPHIHNGKLMLPAPPSPAREPKKQPATKYCDENNCCTVCGEGASGGNHSNCWIPNPLVKHKSPAREKEKAE